MKNHTLKLVVPIFLLCTLLLFCKNNKSGRPTIPFTLDHNRMLVSGEIQRKDGSWKETVLWVDTGNPDFFMSEELAIDLGITLPADSLIPSNGKLELPLPDGVRIGGVQLNFDSVKCFVVYKPRWLFTASHNDANIPSKVLQHYDVVFDYPAKTMTLSNPGNLPFMGISAPARIHPGTGIVQIDGVMLSDSLSFAIDIGASYCFGSSEFLTSFMNAYPDQFSCHGAVGCANIWGWLPNEDNWTMVRIPEISFGELALKNFGMTIPPDYNDMGFGMMDWYSQKTEHPVDGFLGPNAWADYSVGIDYLNSRVYVDKKRSSDYYDMDLVGLILRPEADSSFSILGVAVKDVVPLVDNVKSGDLLLQIDDFIVKGKTMGTVIDALRGKPGDIKNLLLERDGNKISVKAKINRII